MDTQRTRRLLNLLCITVALLLSLAACGRDPRKPGTLDPRLIGTWESRRDFVSTDTLEFRDDGTVKVTAQDGQQKKSYTGQWYVTKSGKESIQVSMQAKGKAAFRSRRILFRDDGTFELRDGDAILGRFQRKLKA